LRQRRSLWSLCHRAVHLSRNLGKPHLQNSSNCRKRTLPSNLISIFPVEGGFPDFCQAEDGEHHTTLNQPPQDSSVDLCSDIPVPTIMSSESKHPKTAPGPRVSTGATLIFPFNTTRNPRGCISATYTPLEARSYFAPPEAGMFRGGWGAATVHIVRYADYPAGNMILLDMKGMVFTSPHSGP
jgi:hypothetical protein